MKCLRCCQELPCPVCAACGFSHKEGAVLLSILPEEKLSINRQKVSMGSEQDLFATNAVEINECKALAEYYYKKEKHIWDKEPELHHEPRNGAEPVMTGRCVRKLLEAGGELTVEQAYILARELQYSCEYAGETAVAEDIIRWMTVAAEQGHPLAQRFLLKCYSKGRFAKQDAVQAEYWRKKIHENYNASVGSID